MSNPYPNNANVPPVDRMRQEVDRWLEAVRSTGERAMESLGLGGARNRSIIPPVDVTELPEEVVVQIDLPGISAELVELTIVGNMLSVSANAPSHNFPMLKLMSTHENVSPGNSPAIDSVASSCRRKPDPSRSPRRPVNSHAEKSPFHSGPTNSGVDEE